MAKSLNADPVVMERGTKARKAPTLEMLKKNLKLDDEGLSKLGRVEKAYNKYNSDIKPDLYLKIVLNDPSTIVKKPVDGKTAKLEFYPYTTVVKYKPTKEELEKDEKLEKLLDKDGNLEKEEVRYLMVESTVKKLGEYSRWLVTHTKNGNILEEDLEDAKELLESFHRFKNNIKETDFEAADINNYNCLNVTGNRGFEEKPLIDVVYRYRKPGASDDENLLISNRYYINTKEAELFFEDDEWLVVIPRTPEASAFYANKTEWCTRREGQFHSYSRRGDLYIFIDKNKLNQHSDVMRRLQFHFEDNHFMDIRDYSITGKNGINEVTDWFDKYDWRFVKKDRELIQIKIKRNLKSMGDEELTEFIKEKTQNIDPTLRLKILNYLLQQFVENNDGYRNNNGEDKILLLKDCFPEQREYLELKFVDTKDYGTEELEQHFERISNLEKVEKEELLERAITKVIADFRVLYPHYRKQGKKYIIQNVVKSVKYFESDVADQYIQDMKDVLDEKETAKIIMEIIDCFEDADIKDVNKSCYKILDSFPEALRFICSSPEEELKNL
jgi:hypothetical protein